MKETLKEKGLSPAQTVISTYPSWEELYNHAKSVGCYSRQIDMFYATAKPEYKWEWVAQLMDGLCRTNQQRPFYDGYTIKVNKNTGFQSYKDSEATMFDFSGTRQFKVSGDEFLACLKIVFANWTVYPNITDEMMDAYGEFKGSTTDIYTILD
jgi:hypothetical protein